MVEHKKAALGVPRRCKTNDKLILALCHGNCFHFEQELAIQGFCGRDKTTLEK